MESTLAWGHGREFRKQQESSAPPEPRSRSSSVEAGQIKAEALPLTDARAARSRSSPRGQDPKGSERETGRGAADAGSCKPRDRRRSRDGSEPLTVAEEAARRQRREAERVEWERTRLERERKHREREAQRERQETQRAKERAERRRRERDEREKKEWAEDATRLASRIHSLCEDCTMKEIMTCAALHPFFPSLLTPKSPKITSTQVKAMNSSEQSLLHSSTTNPLGIASENQCPHQQLAVFYWELIQSMRTLLQEPDWYPLLQVG